MGVITMKMMSNTYITSTIGVTLMSELTFLPSSRFAKAIVFAYFQFRNAFKIQLRRSLPLALSGRLRLLSNCYF